MSIETTMTRAWQRQAAWLWLLLPVSWLYGFITMLRRQAYKIGLLSSYRAPIPVMVIGNITVGGSGKTPLIIELVTHLQKQDLKVGVSAVVMVVIAARCQLWCMLIVCQAS